MEDKVDKEAIRSQVEYYLSDQNLERDLYTKNLLMENEYMDLSLLLNYKKLSVNNIR